MELELSPIDRSFMYHFRYHRKVIRLCRAIAAIHVDGRLFNRLAPKELRNSKDNQKIRWALENRLRELLRKNGDFPLKEQTEQWLKAVKRG